MPDDKNHIISIYQILAQIFYARFHNSSYPVSHNRSFINFFRNYKHIFVLRKVILNYAQCKKRRRHE